MTERSRCVALVPFLDHIDPRCEQGLYALEREGVVVRRVQGFSGIDFGRSVMATQALDDGFDELLWVDSDIVFQPSDVAKLRSHRLPFVAGVAAKKHSRELGCEFLPGVVNVTFGPAGGLHEVRYVGFSFVFTRREAFDAIRATCDLPVCNRRFGHPLVPYFLPMILTEPDGGHRYLTETYAFCERARAAGIVPHVDTTVRLLHIGPYGYSWDDLRR